MKRPRDVLDVPCPVKSCLAEQDKPCTTDGKEREPHLSRLHRLSRAMVDWNRLQGWTAGEPIR